MRSRSRRRRSPDPSGCRACARTGCAPRSSCRSPSSNGRCTASSAIPGCGASASTRRRVRSCARRRHTKAEYSVFRDGDRCPISEIRRHIWPQRDTKTQRRTRFRSRARRGAAERRARRANRKRTTTGPWRSVVRLRSARLTARPAVQAARVERLCVSVSPSLAQINKSASLRNSVQRADGRGLDVITHPEKILFPDDGITKGELASYYESIAPIMLPHISRRPITMERYPSGIGRKGFWQKDVSRGFPSWLERIEVPKKDGIVHHPLVTDTRSLLWVTNQNTITQHVWTSRAPKLHYPDVCVFDLDPANEDEPEVLRSAALALRDLLGELHLPCWVKTSGSKGFHIVVGLDGKSRMDDVAGFAHAVGTLLVKRDPDHLTQEFSKADRGGRIFVDTGRNGYSATFAAAYTVRAKRSAPVSAPCTWEEIEGGDVSPGTFTLRSMPARIAKVGDLWADMGRRGRSLKRPMEKLRRR